MSENCGAGEAGRESGKGTERRVEGDQWQYPAEFQE